MHFIGKETQAYGSEVTYVESHGMTGSKLGMRQALFASDVEFFFFLPLCLGTLPTRESFSKKDEAEIISINES